MSEMFLLLKAECLKVFGDIKIYWLNYILGNTNVFFMFFGLFYAFSKNEQNNLGKLLFVFGLMYWYFGVHSVDLISILMEEEIEQGTLEQLLMSKTPLSVSLMFRIIAQILFDLFKGTFVFLICVFFFKIDFAVVIRKEFFVSVLVFFIGLIAMYGFGYLIAGLSLIYKRATSIASLSSALILFFSGTTIEIEKFPTSIQCIIKLFPFYWSDCAIKGILTGEYADITIALSGLVVTAISWVLIGFFSLNKCLGVIYEKGTTGNY